MSKKLLLADDSVVIQKLVGLSFANEDVEIVATDNGDDAVVKAREITPDVVLADVVMPGKSGYEVCEEIKQDPALAHVPVLLLTGTFEAFDEDRAASAGADGQITKPFEAQALVERVNEVMNAPAPIVEAPAASAAPTDISETDSDYDFFDADASNLAGDQSEEALVVPPSMTDQTPAIEPDDSGLFGRPGDAAIEDFETEAGDMVLGASMSVAPSNDLDSIDEPSPTAGTPAAAAPDANDATIAILPDSPPPLPPSTGDPLAGFEDDLDDFQNTPPPIPSTPVDLDADLEPPTSDPGATVVANLDGANEDLTIHSPSSAIDNDVAAAPSPSIPGRDALDGPATPHAQATVVANLDVSLAEPPVEAPTPDLDLGPSNVAPEALDFAFDVSEQAPVTQLEDPLGDSFSSLMDISESQILAGPPESESIQMDEAAARSLPDDSIAAGYDVSSSDLATASPPDLEPSLEDGLESSGPSSSIDMDDATETNIQPPSAVDHGIDLAGMEDDDLELATPTPTRHLDDDDARISDLSPIVEQRIQETLEKVAWEAFSDLSETIVKQVIGRVEQIAWEVIPQMAETLVREEIRKMKGDKD